MVSNHNCGCRCRPDDSPFQQTVQAKYRVVGTREPTLDHPASFAVTLPGRPLPVRKAVTNEGGPTRVVLAEDHPVMRRYIEAVLAKECQVLASVDDGDTLQEAVRLHRPDCVVTDLAMPRLNGFSAIRPLLEERSDLKIVFLTTSTEPAIVAFVAATGAHAFVNKEDLDSDLLHAVRAVRAGKPYLSSTIAAAF